MFVINKKSAYDTIEKVSETIRLIREFLLFSYMKKLSLIWLKLVSISF